MSLRRIYRYDHTDPDQPFIICDMWALSERFLTLRAL
jgi:hypothetical protein